MNFCKRFHLNIMITHTPWRQIISHNIYVDICEKRKFKATAVTNILLLVKVQPLLSTFLFFTTC